MKAALGPMLFVCACAFGWPLRAPAAQLADDFEKAKLFDPAFQAARAERDANTMAARVARVAYYPELRYSTARIETESVPRTTLSLTQPLIDADRYVTFREGAPRQRVSDATYLAREQDLAQRFFKAVAEVARARESLILNRSRIDTLRQQANSASRAYELGTGTITDVRDTQVKLDQARAADIGLLARRNAAERQFAAVAGFAPDPGAFELARSKPAPVNAPGESVDATGGNNPQVILARQSEELAELAVLRARGAMLPTVSAVVMRSQSSGISNNYIGLSLNFPLQASTYLQSLGAVSTAAKFHEQTRDAEQKSKLEVARLRELVDAGQAEVAIRLDAIRSAQLSVEANEKSFSGGVRSKIDVINAIQTLYQTKEDHLVAVLALAENLLNLHIELALPLRDALKQVQRILFDPV